MDPIIKKTDTTLETIRVFDAPIAELYHAWIEPEVMNKWYYPTDQYRSSCSVDLRVGGSYEVHRQRPDDDFWAIVVYQAIEPEEKLVFTWSFVDSDEPQTLITVLFCPVDNTVSELTFLHERLPSVERVDGCGRGWSFGFDQLAIALT